MKLAVVGSGIAGLGAAWRLHRTHDVTVYEADSLPGGISRTVEVDGAAVGADRETLAVDTGFVAFNEPSCPRLTALLVELGVETQPVEASFSVMLDGGHREYSGHLGGVLAQPGRPFDTRFLRMLRDMVRFRRKAGALAREMRGSQSSIREVLTARGYSDAFLDDYLLPLGAAVRFAPLREVAATPAAAFIESLVGLGVLGLGDHLQWCSIGGGSRTYVDLMTAPLGKQLRLKTPVVAVERDTDGARVRDEGGGSERYDGVIIATRADQALAMLGAGATDEERALLGAFRYTDCTALLHTDQRFMPRRRRIWASWNCHACPQGQDGELPMLTCWMNRLHNIATDIPLFVTRNPAESPGAQQMLGQFTQAYPILDTAARRAQSALGEIQGRRVWFCGAYCGLGSHEDALVSGTTVAAQIERAVEYGLLGPAVSAVA